MRWAMLVASVAIGCGSAKPTSRPAASSDSLHLALWRGDEAEVERLVAAGADVNALDAHELPAWIYAVLAHEPRLLARLPGPLVGDAADRRNAIGIAVSSHDVEILGTLLAQGFPADSAAGTTTPLMIAAANGLPDVMALLLDHGAAVDTRDLGGETALVAAQRAGCAACVELLRQRGATAAAEVPVPAHELPSIRAAVERSVPIVVREGAHWTDEPACQSCHHQPMALQVIALAAERGIAVDRAQATKLRAGVLDDGVRFATMVESSLRDETAILRASMETSGDFAFANAWFLSAMIDAGITPRHAEVVAAQLQAAVQRPDGHWRHGPTRGALESSDLVTTALAARVIATYAPGAATDARVAAARRWLIAATPATTLEQVYRLNGLAWTNAAPATVTAAAASLRAAQLPDGSWSHTGTVGDAFTTGLALLALARNAGVAPTDPVYQRGIDFLLRTQEPDGTWFVPSRATPLLKFFESGFPHGRHQFISFAGTAAASLALMLAL